MLFKPDRGVLSLGAAAAADEEGPMPLYSYRCSACNHEFEALVSQSDTPLCPSCGSPQLDRLLSAPAREGRSGEAIQKARSLASREGHFSNFSKSERPRS